MEKLGFLLTIWLQREPNQNIPTVFDYDNIREE